MLQVQIPKKAPKVGGLRLWVRGFIVLLMLFGLTSEAWSQAAPNTAFQLQQFRPWGDPQGMFQTQSGQTLGQWNYLVGLWLNYGNNPMVLRRADGSRSSIVEHQLGMDINAALGLLNWLDFGLSFPMTLFQTGQIPNLQLFDAADRNKDLSGFALSDLKVYLKAQALREDKHFLNLSVLLYLGIPSGDKEKMGGEDTVSFGVNVYLNKHISIVNLGLNVGYRYLPLSTFGNLKLQHEITYSLGAGFRVVQDYLDILVDIGGATAISDVTTATAAPLELYLGLRALPLGNDDLGLTLGGALALTPGYGSPLFRVLLGVVWAPKRRDKDGDGVLDKDDRCPTVPGPRENQGCPWPDTDGDGLTDNIDKCPKVPGPKENQGCPWPDTDGDGLTDNIDKCPKVPGPKENQGCPDTDRDGDGIVDRLDKCPDVPGVKELQGCPKKVLVEVTEKEIKILQKIQFRTGSATILRQSFEILDQVVSVMKSRPKIRVRIEGHTDNVGGVPYNLRLSKRRAASVLQYLTKRGKIAKDRLESEGYGMSKPLLPNTSKENRAKNRRVQFTVLNPTGDVKSTPNTP